MLWIHTPPCVRACRQGDLIVSAGTSYFEDLVTVNNGIVISDGTLTIAAGGEIITDGDLTLGTG